MAGPKSPWPFAELLGMRAKSIGDGDRPVALATGTFYIQSART